MRLWVRNVDKKDNRDKLLSEKVAKYYLQYIRVINLEELLNLKGKGKEIKINEESLEYIKRYITYIAVREGVKSAKRALNDMLTSREFAVDYGKDIYGVLSIPHLILVLPQRVYGYFTYVEGIDAPEYKVLSYLLGFIYIRGKKALKEVKDSEIKYFSFYKEFKFLLESLGKYLSRLPQVGFYRDPLPTDPEWLITAFEAYNILLKTEKDLRVGVKPSKGAEKDREVLRFLLWRLYELYIFYLVARYLERKGYTIKRSTNGRGYVAEKNGKRLNFYFNLQLNKSKLKKVDARTNIRKFRGKPDITLANEKTIIVECKYSFNVGYITMGRFKIMAYTYEYDPNTAILVYPGLKEGNDYDEEDEATRELNKLVNKEGYVQFSYNGKDLYMLKIDPSDNDDDNLRRLDNVLDKYV